MTFVVSHLVCCNIRRTVGSLWSSCVISRRVTHLEPSYRADKLLLCLGHLEGWSHSLHWTPYTTQSFPEWKRYVTWSWLFDKLTYTVGTIQSVTEPWKFGSDSKKMYDAVWPILQRFYKTGIRAQCDPLLSKSFLQRSSDQGRSSISLFKWKLLFQ